MKNASLVVLYDPIHQTSLASTVVCILRIVSGMVGVRKLKRILDEGTFESHGKPKIRKADDIETKQEVNNIEQKGSENFDGVGFHHIHQTVRHFQ